MQKLAIKIEEKDEGKTVEIVLKNAYAVSESYLRRLKRREGALLKNGEPAYTTHTVHAGDVVSFDPADPEKLPITVLDDFRETVLAAASFAKEGDVVILSPACSSFDRFKNFAERGNTFRKIVEEMK